MAGEAQCLGHHTTLGLGMLNYWRRETWLVFTKEKKKNRIGFPCAEGANGFCFCFVFKWSPEASAIILGTLPLTHYMLT